MAQVPRNKEVTRAIRSLVRQTGLATKEANQLAAKRLTRGDYAGAQCLIKVAQAISSFGNEVSALAGRWREIRSADKVRKSGKDWQTPLWEFYRPILQAIVSLNGEATRKEIEGKLEETQTNSLKEGDFVTNAHGVPRWKLMVGRTRKHLIAEGFLTGENPLRWKITSKGEQAAKSGVKGT